MRYPVWSPLARLRVCTDEEIPMAMTQHEHPYRITHVPELAEHMVRDHSSQAVVARAAKIPVTPELHEHMHAEPVRLHPSHLVEPRAFVLVRSVDSTGISGTGYVAEGIEFTDGTVALRWRGQWPTSVVFHDRGMESVLAVHGHDGATTVVWL
jgi:hypothetical protein